MRTFLFTLIGLSSYLYLNAQESINLDSLSQMNYQLVNSRLEWGMLNNEQHGITLYQPVYTNNAISSKLALNHYDTNFSNVSNDTIDFFKGYKEIKHSGGAWGNLILARTKRDLWQVAYYTSDLSAKKFFQVEIQPNSTVISSIYFKDHLYLTANRKNNWKLFIYNNQGKVVSEKEFNNFRSANQPFVSYHNQLESVVLYYYNLEKSMAELNIHIYNDVDLVEEFNLNNYLSGYLRPGILQKTGEDKYTFIGNVNIPGESVSSGFYFLKLDENFTEVGNIYKYNELDNFLQFLSPKKKEDYDRQKVKKLSNGKPFNYADYVNLTFYQYDEDGFIIIGEVYEPIYHTESNYGYRMSYPSMYTVFDGYAFQQFFAVNIDNEGYMNWDQAQSFDYYKLTKSLYPINVFKEHKEQIEGIAVNNDVLNTSVIDIENGTIEKADFPLTGKLFQERFTFVKNTGWYDGASIAIYAVTDRKKSKDQRNYLTFVKLKV